MKGFPLFVSGEARAERERRDSGEARAVGERRPYSARAASVRGWLAHAAHGDTYGLRASLLSSVVIPPVPQPR